MVMLIPSGHAAPSLAALPESGGLDALGPRVVRKRRRRALSVTTLGDGHTAACPTILAQRLLQLRHVIIGNSGDSLCRARRALWDDTPLYPLPPCVGVTMVPSA